MNLRQQLHQAFLLKRWRRQLRHDCPALPAAKVDTVIKAMRDFITLGQNKNYFNEQNFDVVFRRLDQGIKSFFAIDEMRFFFPEDCPDSILGAWNQFDQGILFLDCAVATPILRSVICHEMMHCLTPEFEQHRFWAEVIAESTACDLLDDYLQQPTPTQVPGLVSDWNNSYATRYRSFQQLGDEFLQTLPLMNTADTLTARDRFRKLSQMALVPDNRLWEQMQSTKNFTQIDLITEKLYHERTLSAADITQYRELLAPNVQIINDCIATPIKDCK